MIRRGEACPRPALVHALFIHYQYQGAVPEKEYIGEERDHSLSHTRSTTTCNAKGTRN